MKKAFHPQWYILLLTFAAAVAGAVLRWFQLKTELLPDGALAQGSYLHIVLAVLIAVLICGLIGLLLPLSNRDSWKQVFPKHPLPNALQILCALVIAFANLLLVFSIPIALPASQSPEITLALTKALPVLGILCAVCIGIFSVLCVMGKRPSALLYMLASIYLVVRLIVCFQAWNTDPSIHDYCFKLLAAICSMLGVFQLAGFSFDKGHRRITLFWTLCAAVFCCISLPDFYLLGTVSDFLLNGALMVSMAVSSLCLLFSGEPTDPDGLSDLS